MNQTPPTGQLPRSQFLGFFQSNLHEYKDSFQIIGDALLVEKVRLPEIKIGSIILAEVHNQVGTISADRPTFFRVLATGAGYYDDETKQDVPLDTQPGDIILVGSTSVRMFSTLPLLETHAKDAVGITRESEIQMRFRGDDAFERFFSALNTAAKDAVGSAQ